MSAKITQDFMELLPAYGRDYKNKASLEADFRSGKDFMEAMSGSYCSVRDFAQGVKVIFRYKKLQSVTSLTV